MEDILNRLTPIQQHGPHYFKRDDLFEIAGVRGGKVRTCYALAAKAGRGLTTAGSRSSPQVNIVANIGKALGLPTVAHLPKGELNKEIKLAQEAGCEIIQHRAGYNSVIIARSRQYAAANGFTDIPFGMECEEAVTQTRKQVANLPDHITRIVMPVGGGMSCAGVLHGLADIGRWAVTVVGVVVGADPSKRLARYAPRGFMTNHFQTNLSLQPAGVPYDKYIATPAHIPFTLDPVYEAKCLPFLQEGDLLWCVGIRQSIINKAGN